MMPDLTPNIATPVEKRHLRLREAAEWYGMSEKTLRRRIAEGVLPAYRVGPRSIRVKAEDIAALARRIPAAVAS